MFWFGRHSIWILSLPNGRDIRCALIQKLPPFQCKYAFALNDEMPWNSKLIFLNMKMRSRGKYLARIPIVQQVLLLNRQEDILKSNQMKIRKLRRQLIHFPKPVELENIFAYWVYFTYAHCNRLDWSSNSWSSEMLLTVSLSWGVRFLCFSTSGPLLVSYKFYWCFRLLTMRNQLKNCFDIELGLIFQFLFQRKFHLIFINQFLIEWLKVRMSKWVTNWSKSLLWIFIQ